MAKTSNLQRVILDLVGTDGERIGQVLVRAYRFQPDRMWADQRPYHGVEVEVVGENGSILAEDALKVREQVLLDNLTGEDE